MSIGCPCNVPVASPDGGPPVGQQPATTTRSSTRRITPCCSKSHRRELLVDLCRSLARLHEPTALAELRSHGEHSRRWDASASVESSQSILFTWRGSAAFWRVAPAYF